MKIWFLITEEARWGLIALQAKLFPYIALNIPVDDWKSGWRLIGKLEDTEEIGRLMRKRPHYGRRRPG